MFSLFYGCLVLEGVDMFISFVEVQVEVFIGHPSADIPEAVGAF
jgi:hypothetical protein